jgi:lysophospholipase L1-like esterase
MKCARMQIRMRRTAIIIVIFLTALGGYLWWSYAHIYSYIGSHYTPEPSERVYTIGNGVPETYVALGDSLTAGVGATRKEDTYPYRYASKLGAPVQVTTLGIPGASAATVLADEAPKLDTLGPVVVTLLIGTNDIRNFGLLADFRSNVEKIVREAKAPGTSVIVLGVPNLDNPALVIPPYRWYFAWQRARFNTALQEICATGACTFVSLAPADTNFTKDGPLYSPDKFHPSALGYALWADLIYAATHR